ncbi:MAG: hybrid sensor histidine kinase/response regulator, partial [Eubacterium sp.]|nr:hybrid sensor histidine kinase/response regulator [Eubacterium sp.]
MKKNLRGVCKSSRIAKIACVSLALALVASSVVTLPAFAVKSEKTEDDTETLQGGGVAVTNQVDDMGYSVQLYDGTNGLPTSDANIILPSDDGFVWIGGYSGLIRYDGTNFERLTEPEGITNVNTLFQDSKGRMWVGTNDNGVVVFDDGESWHFDYTNGLLPSSIRSISEDEAGNVLIGTVQGVFYADEKMEIHLLDEPMLNNDYIQKLVSDGNGNIYGNARGGAVFCIKDLKVS